MKLLSCHGILPFLIVVVRMGDWWLGETS